MKILIIDGDADAAGALSRRVSSFGFAVDAVSTGRAALLSVRTQEYDLILLDPLLDTDAMELLGHLRAGKRVPPVLVCCVTDQVATKVLFLNAGADDYLVKPFAFEELLARMHALLRRSAHVVPDILTAGNLELNVGTQSVRRGKRPIALTKKECAMLEYLLRYQGNLISKTSLTEHVWDSSADPFSASVDTHMTNLRRKLGKPPIIETVHGRGFLIR